MAKKVDNSVLDAPLDFLANNSEREVLCSAEPTDYANVSTVALADAALTSGDFTISDGDTSGRKTTIAAKAGTAIDTTGQSTHIALVDDTNSILRYVSTAPSTSLDSSGTVDIGSWKIEIADPA